MCNKKLDYLGIYRFINRLDVVFIFFSSGFFAEERKVVKVAFFPMDGYHITNADGSVGGMDAEYLNALCKYTDWTIEYVICDSWNEALHLLDKKQVDLVGSAQYSSERAKTYLYWFVFLTQPKAER